MAPLDDGDAVLDRGVEVEVVELERRRRAGRRRRARAPGRRRVDGCTRAMTKVGEVTGPRTPSPSPMPWVSVVLPAPRPPVSTTRSPGAQQRARATRPSARVSSTVASRATRRRAAHRHAGGLRAAPRGRGGAWRRRRRGASWRCPGRCGAPAACCSPAAPRRPPAGPGSMSMSSCWVTSSGCSSMMMWPGVLDDDVLGPGDPAHDLLAVRRRGEEVAGAVHDQRLDADERGEARRARSRASMSGRKSAMTSNGVAKIMSPTRCDELGAHRRVERPPLHDDVLHAAAHPAQHADRPGVPRQPGEHAGSDRADDPADGGARARTRSSPRRRGSSTTSATASTRSRTTSGCCPA